ncbi:MAG: hypothetical protein FJX75_06715 [Armatimonadetes bacterium]|nr:hypothetical protein [Armatimonadota bacterium]
MAAMTIDGHNCESAWVEALRHLLQQPRGEARNLVVHIREPQTRDDVTRAAVDEFLAGYGLLPLRHVAYTIFPATLWRRAHGDPERLFTAYNRPGGVFERLRARERAQRRSRWGTYFRRMTRWEGGGQPANQLADLVGMLRDREAVHKAALTVSIVQPQDARRTRGAPCLNYVAIQLDHGSPRRSLSLLAVYRSHNFVQRALGNYMGLADLQAFLCECSGYVPGAMACVSSYATVGQDTDRGRGWPTKARLRTFLGTLGA